MDLHNDQFDSDMLDQWREETFERKANGLSTQSFQDWLETKKFLAELYDNLQVNKEVNKLCTTSWKTTSH